MRSVVPATLFLVLGFLCFSPAVNADTVSLQDALGGSCSATPSGGSDPTQIACQARIKVFCSLIQASGCTTQGKPFQPDFGSNKATFMNKAQKLEADVSRDQQRAESCCSSGSCDLAHYGVADNSGHLNEAVQSNSRNGTRGMRGDSANLANSANQASVHNANVGGACRGMAAVCEQKYKMMAKKLQDQPPCRSGDSDCEGEVSSRKQKYEQAAQSCAGLDSSQYERSAQDLDSAQKQASNSEGKSSGADSGTSAGGAPAGGMDGKDAMQALGKMLPMAMQAMQAMNQQDQQGNQDQQMPMDMMGQQNCYTNPSMAGCTQQPVNDSWNKDMMGDGGIPTGSSSARGNFNMADGGDMARLPSDIADRNGVAGTPPTVRAISGSGGSMPGGGNASAASLGGGGGGGGPGQKPTSVNLGEASGASGFSKIANDMNMQNGGGGGGYSYGGGAGAQSDQMNLADFLPGGRQDPSRARGPAGLAGNNQIQGRSVNIWNRISEKMRNRCAQGLLRDCGL